MDDIQQSLKELEKQLNKAYENQLSQQVFRKESEIKFKENLKALERFLPKLAEEVKQYKPNKSFKLFASNKGVGNFVPTGGTLPLYGEDPMGQAAEQVDRYTKRATFGRFELYNSVNKGMLIDERLHIRFMRELTQSFIDGDLNNQKLLTSLCEHYPTCMMFGLGLGYALSLLVERCSFDYIFVCEPDFETFYASLFCTDWEAILTKVDEQNSNIVLQIGISYNSFFEELSKIASDIGPTSLVSSFCFQHTPSNEVNALIKEFFGRLPQFQSGYGFYNDAITGIAHAIKNLDNKSHLFKGTKKRDTQFKDRVAYVVANGPSLDEAEEVLRQNQGDVVIFAAGTALQSLLKLGIRPDFHVLVERPKVTYDVLLETLSPAELADVNLLGVEVLYPEISGLYKWTGLALKGPEASTMMIQYDHLINKGQVLPSLSFSGPLVANTALSFATSMGFGEIYLFGVDNGYPISGQSHSSYSIYSDEKLGGRYRVNIKAPHELQGNLEGHVRATDLMLEAKNHMERLVKSASHIDYYKVGSGAKLDYVKPLEAHDVLCTPMEVPKKKIIEDIKSTFFIKHNFQNAEASVGLDEFESLCDYLLEIADRPFSTRKEASDILKAQSRLVYAYRGKKFGHLFHIIKGTMLYFHCPLISLLYRFEDEQKNLQYFSNSLDVWKRCIKAMKTDFRDSWRRPCELSLEFARERRRVNRL